MVQVSVNSTRPSPRHFTFDIWHQNAWHLRRRSDLLFPLLALTSLLFYGGFFYGAAGSSLHASGILMVTTSDAKNDHLQGSYAATSNSNLEKSFDKGVDPHELDSRDHLENNLQIKARASPNSSIPLDGSPSRNSDDGVNSNVTLKSSG